MDLIAVAKQAVRLGQLTRQDVEALDLPDQRSGDFQAAAAKLAVIARREHATGRHVTPTALVQALLGDSELWTQAASAPVALGEAAAMGSVEPTQAPDATVFPGMGEPGSARPDIPIEVSAERQTVTLTESPRRGPESPRIWDDPEVAVLKRLAEMVTGEPDAQVRWHEPRSIARSPGASAPVEWAQQLGAPPLIARLAVVRTENWIRAQLGLPRNEPLPTLLGWNAPSAGMAEEVVRGAFARLQHYIRAESDFLTSIIDESRYLESMDRLLVSDTLLGKVPVLDPSGVRLLDLGASFDGDQEVAALALKRPDGQLEVYVLPDTNPDPASVALDPLALVGKLKSLPPGSTLLGIAHWGGHQSTVGPIPSGPAVGDALVGDLAQNDRLHAWLRYGAREAGLDVAPRFGSFVVGRDVTSTEAVQYRAHVYGDFPMLDEFAPAPRPLDESPLVLDAPRLGVVGRLPSLSAESIFERAKADLHEELARGDFTLDQLRAFVSEHVHGVSVGNTEVLVVDFDHENRANMDPASLDPVLKAFVGGAGVKALVQEYFDPELRQNALETPLVGRLVRHVYDQKVSRINRIQTFVNLADVAAQANIPVVTMDLGNRPIYEFYNLMPSIAGYFALATNHIPAGAYLLGQFFFNKVSEMLHKGTFDPDTVHAWERLQLEVNDARRLFIARGLVQLATELKAGPDDQARPQIIVAYPRAHAIRIAEYLTSPHALDRVLTELKTFLYRRLPGLDFNVRTWAHAPEGGQADWLLENRTPLWRQWT